MNSTTYYEQVSKMRKPKSIRKGIKPSFVPSMDTKLVTINTIGNKGALELFNNILENRILYIKPDHILTKKTSSCFNYFKKEAPHMDIEINKHLISDELKLKKCNNDAFKFKTIMEAQIIASGDDKPFEMSIHVCKYDKKTEQKRLALRKKITGKKNTTKYETTTNEEECIQSVMVEKLDSSCWYYLTGGDKSVYLPLNIVRESKTSNEMNFHYSKDMLKFPLKGALNNLQTDDNGVVCRNVDVTREIIVRNSKRNRSFWITPDNTIDEDTKCTYKIVPKTASKGSNIYITDDSTAPGCYKVVVGVRKKTNNKPKRSLKRTLSESSDSSSTSSSSSSSEEEPIKRFKKISKPLSLYDEESE